LCVCEDETKFARNFGATPHASSQTHKVDTKIIHLPAKRWVEIEPVGQPRLPA